MAASPMKRWADTVTAGWDVHGNCLDAALKKGAPIFRDLHCCVERSEERLEGNIFSSDGHSLDENMDAKRRNLFAFASSLKTCEAPSILEVGFNAGHSVCLMLLANPRARVVAFDLCEHCYTRDCAEVLRRHFGAEHLELVIGDSTSTIPEWRRANPSSRFDLIHIDGGHQFSVAASDLDNCSKLGRSGSVIVLDDTDIVGVNAAWTDFLASGRAVELRPPFELNRRYMHGVGHLLLEHHCASCGASGTVACGGCQVVRYCGQSHARAHWPRHRSVCAARRCPPVQFACPREITPPSRSARLCGIQGKHNRQFHVLATERLAKGHVLFSEMPTSWQPLRDRRLRLCIGCGVPVAATPGSLICQGCGHSTACGTCAAAGVFSCRMCPELKISHGSVGPHVLMVLDLVRRWQARELCSGALLQPRPGTVGEQERKIAASVQKVGHWYSAVRWSEELATEVVAATEAGRIDLTSDGVPLGIGYYSAFAMLRSGSLGKGVEGTNVKVVCEPTPNHAFTISAILTRDVEIGERLCI